MKKRLACFVFVLTFPAFVFAQEKLNQVTSPTSPAASVLDMQPATILSPKSYQALETALYSNFRDGNQTVIPNNFALEFTPYWARNHQLSLIDYLYPKGAWEQIKRNSSFSLASTQQFTLGDSTKTNALGLGYRTTFYFGGEGDRDKITAFKSALNKDQQIVSSIVSSAVLLITSGNLSGSEDLFLKLKPSAEQVLQEHKVSGALSGKFIAELELEIMALKDTALTNSSDLANNISHVTTAIREAYDAAFVTDILYREFKDYIRNRNGFHLDVAYASFLNFPGNNFEYSIMPRQSVWLTPAYRFKDRLKYLKIMGVLKYEWSNTRYYDQFFPGNDVYRNNIDYGLAVAAQLNNLSVQLELVGRAGTTEIFAGTDVNGNRLYRKHQRSDIQYIGTFNYNLTDQIILSYSFGKRFQVIQANDKTLVSLLSLNLGFGAPTRKNLK